jgi:hypothetical protein
MHRQDSARKSHVKDDATSSFNTLTERTIFFTIRYQRDIVVRNGELRVTRIPKLSIKNGMGKDWKTTQL